jgi:hypothetical protein
MEERGTWFYEIKLFVMTESDNLLSRRSAAEVPFKTFRCGYINEHSFCQSLLLAD